MHSIDRINFILLFLSHFQARQFVHCDYLLELHVPHPRNRFPRAFPIEHSDRDLPVIADELFADHI